MKYPKRLGCKYGMPHDLKILGENQKIKAEICMKCGKKFKWNKSKMGRVDNEEYLKAHVRNFAQKFGRTKRVYYKVYKPEKTIIKL